jgi:hypothetical protein
MIKRFTYQIGTISRMKLFNLVLFSLCSACTISIGTGSKTYMEIPQQSGQAIFHILTEDIVINGKSTYPGQTIKEQAGNTKIVFNGKVLRPVTVKSETTALEETAESLRFLTCLAFLPICALSRGDVFETTPATTSYVNSDCTGRTILHSESDVMYKIKLEKIFDKPPTLIIEYDSGTSYRLIEQELTCTDPEQTV